MKLKDIMSRNVEAISADSNLFAAADRMARFDIGFLPVFEDIGGIVGIVTDRDLVIRALADARDPSTTTVGEIMTKGLLTMSPEEDVEQAAKLMEEKQIRRVVLKDQAGAYIGVVSLGDLAQRTHDRELSGEALEKVCDPSATAT
jgi:CBS domain-containing protein